METCLCKGGITGEEVLSSDLLGKLDKRDNDMEEMACHFLWLGVEEEKKVQMIPVLKSPVWNSKTWNHS